MSILLSYGFYYIKHHHIMNNNALISTAEMLSCNVWQNWLSSTDLPTQLSNLWQLTVKPLTVHSPCLKGQTSRD